MPIDIRVDDDDAQKRLLKAAHIISDLRGFWPLVVPLYIKWMGRQFDSEGSYWGSGWRQLTPAYAAWKAIAYPGKGILVATGQLKGAALAPKRQQTPSQLVLTISSPKVEWQEKQGRVLIGANLPSDARNELEQAAISYVTKALKGL